jgi:hypothetical protein
MRTYSYSQLSQYLACPRKYRYRYIDGWQERDTRAATIFGRVFEHALGALFRKEDPTAAFYDEWSLYRNVVLEYSRGDTWDRMIEQAVKLVEQFVRDERILVPEPLRNLQVKYVQRLSETSEFVAYIDALGSLDGRGRLLEWKTTGARYPEQPAGLYALDQQLIAYSWITGIAEVVMVVFVRKKNPEIQYLEITIYRAATAGVRRPGGGIDPADRVRALSPSHRCALPAERMRDLRLPGAVPRSAGTGRDTPGTSTGRGPD